MLRCVACGLAYSGCTCVLLCVHMCTAAPAAIEAAVCCTELCVCWGAAVDVACCTLLIDVLNPVLRLLLLLQGSCCLCRRAPASLQWGLHVLVPVLLRVGSSHDVCLHDYGSGVVHCQATCLAEQHNTWGLIQLLCLWQVADVCVCRGNSFFRAHVGLHINKMCVPATPVL